MTRLAPTVAVATLSLLSASRALAQLPDLGEISTQFLPGVSADVPGGDPGADPRVQVSTYEAAVNAPLVLSPTAFLVLGAAYHVDSVSYAGFPSGAAELRAFHSLELPVTSSCCPTAGRRRGRRARASPGALRCADLSEVLSRAHRGRGGPVPRAARRNGDPVAAHVRLA